MAVSLTTGKPRSPSADGAPASARRTIAIERAGLGALLAALDNGLAAPFGEAVAAIGSARGRVIITGVGKSGHIARKVASTLASTGTPAYFVHPAEASHGDLGMVTADDVIVAMSWSGESAELRSMVEHSRRFRIRLIACTSASESTLARAADIALILPAAEEACPHGLAPTTSTLMQLALGDALAMALLESRGFTADDFHVLHPGGKLGASLHYVRDIMQRGEALPLAPLGATMSDAIMLISEKRIGCVGIVAPDGHLVGVITDGDLRRRLGQANLLEMKVDDVMTTTPKTAPPETLVGAALDLLNQTQITVLFIVDDGKPVGVVHMHDLLRLGVA